MRILGVDYGLKRTGIAIWDSEVDLILPMTVIDEKEIENIAQSVADIASTEKTELIVIGYPKTLNNEVTGKQIEVTNKFIEILKDRTRIPIEIEDERLSTGVARRLQSQIGRKQTTSVDDLAAAAILESYVQRKKPAREN